MWTSQRLNLRGVRFFDKVGAMETLADFIARRRRELDEAEAKLIEELRVIAQERATLKQAEIAASKPKDVETEFQQLLSKKNSKRKRNIKQNTIMDSVIKILEKHMDGLIALDILRELNKVREFPLLRTSLSPQLSRLRQAGYIELDGSSWRLLKTSVGQTPENIEAADGVPGGGPSTASDSQLTREPGSGGGT